MIAQQACARAKEMDPSLNEVNLALGELDILWDADGSVYMTGPAAFAFEGETC